MSKENPDRYGRKLLMPLSDFEGNCRRALEDPVIARTLTVGVVELLANAIRLARECADRDKITC